MRPSRIRDKKMPAVTQYPDFEPSSGTKQLWLSTRKAEVNVTNNMTLPGLFNTKGYSSDKSLFFFAMTLEVIGFLIISALADWGVLIAGTVLALVVIDVFLAIGLHWKQSQICLLSNKKATETRGGMAAIKLEAQIKKLKRWWGGKLCVILLWVFAVIKASGFYVLNPDTYIFGILMFLIYSFIAYVHIFHTGYFLAEFRFRRALNKEVNEFLKGNVAYIVPRFREYGLEPTNDLISVEFKDEIHEDERGISANALVCDNSKWNLITWGLMDDGDLGKMLNGNKKVKEYLAVEYLKVQLDILMKNPPVAVGPKLEEMQDKLHNIN